jgi:hypothetical protein
MYQTVEDTWVYSPHPPEEYLLPNPNAPTMPTRLYFCAANNLGAWNLLWSLFPILDLAITHPEILAKKIDFALMGSISGSYFVHPFSKRDEIDDIPVRERFEKSLLQPPTDTLITKMIEIQVGWGLDRNFDLRKRLSQNFYATTNIVEVDFLKKKIKA